MKGNNMQTNSTPKHRAEVESAETGRAELAAIVEASKSPITWANSTARHRKLDSLTEWNRRADTARIFYDTGRLA
jgi:hypothetical protein